MEELNFEENEILEVKKTKKGGFWKGFFCATILFTVVAAICICIGLFIKVKTYSSGSGNLVTQSEEVQSKLAFLEAYIRGYYLEEIDDDQMEDYLYYGLVAGLGDPYAAYYNEEETQSMLDSSSGNYCGIGAVFSQNLITGMITVTRVYEGCPSYEAGLLPEDILYKVEDEEVTGQDLTNVVTKIKGEEGTEVTLTMIRGEEYIDFTMKRQMIEVPTIEHEMLADVLLPEGPIVYTEYKGEEKEARNSDSECVDVPIAVLMNGASASASEILSGALQDYGVAKIVGTQSYGKGIVQSIFDLQDGTALKLTTAKYYTPNGNDIHEIGITPDVEIDLPEELKTEVTLSFEEDVQLQKAIEVLQQ